MNLQSKRVKQVPRKNYVASVSSGISSTPAPTVRADGADGDAIARMARVFGVPAPVELGHRSGAPYLRADERFATLGEPNTAINSGDANFSTVLSASFAVAARDSRVNTGKWKLCYFAVVGTI